jgi:hypothetical protein
VFRAEKVKKRAIRIVTNSPHLLKVKAFSKKSLSCLEKADAGREKQSLLSQVVSALARSCCPKEEEEAEFKMEEESGPLAQEKSDIEHLTLRSSGKR